MSTLWTPGGEHPVPRSPSGGPDGARDAGDAAGGGDAGSGRSSGPEKPRRQAGTSGQPWVGQGDLTQEEVEQARAEMEAVREQLLAAPAEVVVANHAMGLWELAALHLSQRPPGLAQAQLAIDALTVLVEGLEGRLGEAETTLADGLANLRMAFVQIASAQRQGAEGQATG